MRAVNYSINRAAATVTFKLDDVIASRGEVFALPGIYTISNGTVTYKMQDLPPELGVVL